MRRLAVPAALVVAAGILAVALALVFEAREDVPPDANARPASMRVLSAAIDPPVHAFGEPVVAQLDLAGDTTIVRLDSVRVFAEFAPYERTGPVQVERTVTGTAVRWRFRFPLRCVREGCAPDGERRSFDLPAGGIQYRFVSTPGPASALVEWPPIEVVGRVGSDALASRAWRADTASAADVSYRLAPGTLAATLVGGSVLFVGLGLALVWWLARRREEELPELAAVAGPTISPLEQALGLAREAARNGDSPERRTALERAARELGARGFSELAERARVLAWSPGRADTGAVEEFARDAGAAAGEEEA